jgi:NADH-quinone oxidoreductase subunit C
MTAADARARILERFGLDAVADGGVTVSLPGERWQEVARFARDELGCRYFTWLSAVDWKDQGFEVLCRVENLATALVLTMRTRLAAGETSCPTLTGVYRGADWMERECFDMFGIVFAGHPDLRRILLGDDWVGHPLRKAYAVDTPLAPYR